MPLTPLNFFILVMAAIRDRRLERELDDEVWAVWVADGSANPDGTLNHEVIRARATPLWEVIHAEDTASVVD